MPFTLPKHIYLSRNPVAVWLAATAQRLGTELAFASAFFLDKAMAVTCIMHVGLRELPLGLCVSKWCKAMGAGLQSWMSLRTSCPQDLPFGAKTRKRRWGTHYWTNLWHLGHGQGGPWPLVLLCSLPQQLLPWQVMQSHCSQRHTKHGHTHGSQGQAGLATATTTVALLVVRSPGSQLLPITQISHGNTVTYTWMPLLFNLP